MCGSILRGVQGQDLSQENLQPFLFDQQGLVNTKLLNFLEVFHLLLPSV